MFCVTLYFPKPFEVLGEKYHFHELDSIQEAFWHVSFAESVWGQPPPFKVLVDGRDMSDQYATWPNSAFDEEEIVLPRSIF